MNLAGRTVLMMGASRGIGKAIPPRHVARANFVTAANSTQENHKVSDMSTRKHDLMLGGPLLTAAPVKHNPSMTTYRMSMTVRNFSSDATSPPAKIFQAISSLITSDHVSSFGGSFSFKLSGADEGVWYLDLKEGSGSAGQGEPPSGEPDCTMSMDSADFVDMFQGNLKATQAFMGGKLKIQGDLGLAMKLEKLMNQMNQK